MASPLLVEGEEPITFAEIEPKHRDKLVEMHEELFPVSYSKQFYNKAIKKEGLRGGPLFTSIAFQKRNGVDEMVGFVMAQFLPILKCDERCELFDGMSEPPLVYYILTLGIDKQMRRTGLGTELLRQCIRNASSDPNCGAVSEVNDMHAVFLLPSFIYIVCLYDVTQYFYCSVYKHVLIFDCFLLFSPPSYIYMSSVITYRPCAFTRKMVSYLSQNSQVSSQTLRNTDTDVDADSGIRE